MILPASLCCPTGVPALDRGLGIGGYPRGRMVEIFGAPSSGKTRLSLRAIAAAQERGGSAAFVDVERSLGLRWARSLGVDVGSLWIGTPPHGEAALETARLLAASGAIALIVLDSIAALAPRACLARSLPGPPAPLREPWAQELRALRTTAARTHTTILLINQVRQRIGGATFTPGGASVRLNVSIRLALCCAGRPRITIVKNALVPLRRAIQIEASSRVERTHRGERAWG